MVLNELVQSQWDVCFVIWTKWRGRGEVVVVLVVECLDSQLGTKG